MTYEATASVPSAAPRRRRGRTVETKLRRAWRRERRFHHSRGLCHLLLWVTALVLVDLLVDRLFLVPGYGRVLLLAINAAALLAVLYRQWWRHLRRYDPVRVALQVERRHPELQSALVSYVQFDEDAPRSDVISPALIRALRREAVRMTQPVDFREIVSFRELRRIFLFSCLVVMFFAIISVNWFDLLQTFLYRMANPAASLEYPTRTRIEQIVAPDTIRQGDPFRLEATCSGVVPATGRLIHRPDDGDRETVPIHRNTEGRFTFSRKAVYRSFSYYLRIGDDVSSEYAVRVVPPPRVVRAKVRIRYPAYIRPEPEEVTRLNLEVPEGSELTWHVRCDRPLAVARMWIEDGPEPVELKLEDDRRGGTVTLPATQSFYYRFEWVDLRHKYPYPSDVQYFVQVIPDGPPDVDLLEPLEDEKATVRKRLSLHFRAADDHGIAKAWIVYQVNDGPERKEPIGSFDTQPVEARPVWRLKESIPALKVDDTITYAVEVADTRTGAKGPNVSRSRPLRVSVVRLADYLRYIFEKKARLVKEMESLYQEETEASQSVGGLQGDSLSTTQPASRPAP
jgi:hypothetical protein